MRMALALVMVYIYVGARHLKLLKCGRLEEGTNEH